MGEFSIEKYRGAIKSNIGLNIDPYSIRMQKNIKEKEKIAEKAKEFIKDDLTYFVGVGSTLLQLILKWPRDSKSSILTNSTIIPILLSNHGNIEIFTTGGIVLNNYLSVIGPQAEEYLNNFSIDIAFMGCFCISNLLKIGEPDIFQASILNKVSKISKKKILLVDHSKFGVEKGYKYLDIEDIDIIITSKKTPVEFLKKIAKKNVEVILVS